MGKNSKGKIFRGIENVYKKIGLDGGLSSRFPLENPLKKKKPSLKCHQAGLNSGRLLVLLLLLLLFLIPLLYHDYSLLLQLLATSTYLSVIPRNASKWIGGTP